LPPFSPNPENPTDLLWPDHSVGETNDIRPIVEIADPKDIEVIRIFKGYHKHRDAYSGFDMGVTALNGNALDGYEVAKGAKTLDQVLQEARVQTVRIL
jgi:hypothetical protein